MKKILSVFMAIVMIFSIGSIASFAAETVEITFDDCPYDIAPYRTDYIGKYMGYQYGIDYWFTITNADGTTTEIKGYPFSIEVEVGTALEFTVSIADYIEPTSVRMIAYPTGTAMSDLYDELTGSPYEQYYIAKSTANTYGIIPNKDLTICMSEYHLYNDCFMYEFPSSSYYTSKRVQKNVDATTPWDMYTDFEWNNTKVIYENETIYIEIAIPLDDFANEYHYESYQVYYTTGYSGDEYVKTYLRKPASEKEGTEEVDLRVAHYETDTHWIDIYEIPNADPTMEFKVSGVVTYTLGMLEEFFNDFSLEELGSLDLGSMDLGPMVEFVVRLLTLIVKLLASFGIQIDISSLI